MLVTAWARGTFFGAWATPSTAAPRATTVRSPKRSQLVRFLPVLIEGTLRQIGRTPEHDRALTCGRAGAGVVGDIMPAAQMPMRWASSSRW